MNHNVTTASHHYSCRCSLYSLHGAIAAALAISLHLSAHRSYANENSVDPLFDGKSLDGWETPKADRHWWKESEGAIAGGSLEQDVPDNTFLSTKQSFENFELTLKLRIRGNGGFINSGVQIRSIRVPNSSEMSGYQVDAGNDWWGKLYDESRRNRVIAEPPDPSTLQKAVRENDWNEYRICAEGPRIRSWINGVAALDYVEREPNIPLDGHIAFQVHGGGKALVEFKDVEIRELPPSKGAMTWRRLHKADATKKDVSSPAEEARGFTVPEGFEVELVAAETETYGKFVCLAFDSRGRLWTMTAMEYPVDANENPEASRQLFAVGGRDQVLVFDKPWEKDVAPPSVFADGLVMPLGILPYRDGAYVQYGSEIRFYRDVNGDGRADEHQTILKGFGTQDSHLFPHQFTRVPGEQILIAQGLFNSSTVRRPGNVPFDDGAIEIPFNYCKLASFSPDGSQFEALTAGPNNIWGLAISREGEIWIQEANDMGFPIIPYAPGGYYPTGTTDRLRPYQPLMPEPLGPAQMGGTGLSGLALADDTDGWPSPWGANEAGPDAPKVFYVANPITSSIQTITAHPAGHRYTYSKGPDFLTSADRRFRPVALQFGPDGCLYVVDWYNKIISHNEAPRDHPERDKKSGRIWRVRHRSQPHRAPPNLAATSTQGLLSYLGHANARLAALTWQELIDRQETGVVDDLQRFVGDRELPAAKRLGALWALEGLARVPVPLLSALANDSHAGLRAEAVRIAGRQCDEDDFLHVAGSLADDESSRVRAALGDALHRVPFTKAAGVALMMELAKKPLSGNGWDAYDREFERFLARWAMERHAPLVAGYLNSASGKQMPLESRVLATLALDEPRAATELAKLIPDLTRPLSEEEIRVLSGQLHDRGVADAMRQALENPASRLNVLRGLLRIRTKIESPDLKNIVSTAVADLWDEDESLEGRQAAIEAARAFGLQQLEKKITKLATAPSTPLDVKLQSLGALREIGASDAAAIVELIQRPETEQRVRAEALAALADSRYDETSVALLEMWDDLNVDERELAVTRMAAHRDGARALLAAWEAGDVDSADLSVVALERMRGLLPGNELMEQLWSEVADRLQRVLRLTGLNEDAGATISLSGPFTVECWAQLGPDISNADSLLAGENSLDANFYDGRFRVWVRGQGDAVVAKIETVPAVWRHYAVTRDAEGRFRIYVNGELQGVSQAVQTDNFANLHVGWSSSNAGGTNAQLAEFRVWKVERDANQIRDNFDRSFAGESWPEDIVHLYGDDDWGSLAGGAHIEPTLDAPTLITASQAEQRAKTFATYRKLAAMPGDSANGQALFKRHCMTCHQVAGEGAKIGPPLDGVGLTGVEALLRNILTPSAAMESGYRNFLVLTRDGLIVDGLLVSRDEQSIVLRRPERADAVFPLAEVVRADFSTSSVMPEGVLQSLKPQEVSDLFSYLLKNNQSSEAENKQRN
ncbi:MAG: DUF1080 domain-containing protein [Pirellulales bacterium]|nr:DUF1080 domain-containing protein [Pirellulales bacterium]